MISGREYEELLLHQRNEKVKKLEILRTSFMYEKHYFQLETFMNIEG